MKTGIELIAQERKEQIDKHGRTVERDVAINSNHQLVKAVISMLESNGPRGMERNCPKGWDSVLWKKIVGKPYQERLIIAGALIAAEIDRLNAVVERGAGDDYPIITLTHKD